MFDFTLALLGGLPLPIPNSPLLIQQPTIELVARLGEDAFFESMKFSQITKETYLNQVKESKPEMYDEVYLMDELSVFLSIMDSYSGLKQQTEIALELLFPSAKIVVNNHMITINGYLLTAENFVFMQESVGKMIGLNGQAASKEFNPGNEQAKEIEAKLLQGRRKIAEERKMNKSSSGQSLSNYISALAVGLQMPIQDVMKYTLYQFYDQLKRFSRKQSADSALQAMLAGAKDVKTIDWMGSDEDKN